MKGSLELYCRGPGHPQFRSEVFYLVKERGTIFIGPPATAFGLPVMRLGISTLAGDGNRSLSPPATAYTYIYTYLFVFELQHVIFFTWLV